MATRGNPYRGKAQTNIPRVAYLWRRWWSVLRSKHHGIPWSGQLVLLLLPFAVSTIALVFVPALLGLPLAFTSYDSFSSPRFNGLQNFRDLWNDRIFHIALGNTLWFIAMAVPLRLACAMATAILFLRRSPGVGPMRTAIVLPTMVPDVAWALAWLWILNPIYGPLNLILGTIGVNGPAWMLDQQGAQFAIILMMSWQFGEGFVVCLGALSEIPNDILDQARVDGATRARQFLSITLPLILPYLVILLVRDVLFSLHANFVPAKILGQDGGPNYATTYLPTWIYTNAFSYLRLGYAASMTWVTFLVTLVLMAPAFILISRRWEDWKT